MVPNCPPIKSYIERVDYHHGGFERDAFIINQHHSMHATIFLDESGNLTFPDGDIVLDVLVLRWKTRI